MEAIVRSREKDGMPRGVPGTLVTGRALAEHGYLDHRSYKRLAIHLDLVDVHLGARPESQRLVNAWARDAGYSGLAGCKPLLDKWRQAVQRSLAQSPARTRTSWNNDDRHELAHATATDRAGQAQRHFLRELLHAADGRALGALPAIWELQPEFDDDDYAQEPPKDRSSNHRFSGESSADSSEAALLTGPTKQLGARRWTGNAKFRGATAGGRSDIPCKYTLRGRRHAYRCTRGSARVGRMCWLGRCLPVGEKSRQRRWLGRSVRFQISCLLKW